MVGKRPRGEGTPGAMAHTSKAGEGVNKPTRVRPQHAPTATVTIPGGQQLIVCLDCADELRTSYPPLACQFRDWHLVQHLHRSEARPSGDAD
jgi:hypothetical protein